MILGKIDAFRISNPQRLTGHINDIRMYERRLWNFEDQSSINDKLLHEILVEGPPRRVSFELDEATVNKPKVNDRPTKKRLPFLSSLSTLPKAIVDKTNLPVTDKIVYSCPPLEGRILPNPDFQESVKEYCCLCKDCSVPYNHPLYGMVVGKKWLKPSYALVMAGLVDPSYIDPNPWHGCRPLCEDTTKWYRYMRKFWKGIFSLQDILLHEKLSAEVRLVVPKVD